MSNERFVIRTVEEMTVGEPYRNGWYHDNLRTRRDAASYIERGAPIPSGLMIFIFTEERSRNGGFFIVDQHDAWHAGAIIRQIPEPIMRPATPSDADLVAAYERFQRGADRGAMFPERGPTSNVAGICLAINGEPVVVSMRLIKAAWSRELERRTSGSRLDLSTNHVACQGTLPADLDL